MKYVLQISSSLSRGGQEMFIMNVFRHIDRNNIMFDFLVFTDSNEGFYEEVLSSKACIYRLPPRRLGYLKYRKNLDDFFRRYSSKYTAVHFHMCTLTDILPIYYANKYNIPIRIIHSHNSTWSRGIHNYLFHLINKFRITKYANRFLACSEKAAHWFYFRSNKNVHIVKNGINVNTFLYNVDERNKVRKNLNIGSNFVVGHTGRFAKVKNHTFIIDVFDEFLKFEPNAILLLIGNGECFDKIKSKIAACGLQRKVLLLGLQDNVGPYLQAMDCFLFPSLFEGLPFSLVEAQCSDLLVVASDTISKSAKLTSNFYFLSLNHSAKYWAEFLFAHKSYYRSNLKTEFEGNGYSIMNTVDFLTKVYNGNVL